MSKICIKFSVLLLVQAIVALNCAAQAAKEGQSNVSKYEMQIVSIFEGDKPEFIFVIGGSGFRSVASLKQFLSKLPQGSELSWAPGCIRLGGEPLLSSESEMEDFKNFLGTHRIKFRLIPSG